MVFDHAIASVFSAARRIPVVDRNAGVILHYNTNAFTHQEPDMQKAVTKAPPPLGHGGQT